MKLSGTRKSSKGQRGFTVMEMLAYIILFVGLLSFAYRAVTASSRGIGALQNNAYDIIRVTKAGERWRQDIREAVSPPVVESQTVDIPRSDEEVILVDQKEGFDEESPTEITSFVPVKSKTIKTTSLKIVKASNTIWYVFRQGKIYRQDRLNPENEELVLKNVAASIMTSESRGETIAWRWEVELKTTRQDVLTRPLFSFISVPRKEQEP